jgi:hypothetical protein
MLKLLLTTSSAAPAGAPRLPITRNFGEYAFLEDSRYVVNYKMRASPAGNPRSG